ncbi:putative proliferating cell nuclear antigen [Acanthamoeba polyphaga mimivirus]|uniref:Proliferating cell nuclear antigen n=1 Tax=Acanthamoeba polyphaga mimivirus Kroon TaxID=3069720 RepID=A0A0G2Y9N1_9VIRU|nr:putative proliferating cell nuclear antigen [Acanthamoeba polyphaga mimivirus]AKI79841.1 putative proliferating cell nuclear antigen [Acanthamoeba polyphaga mimivirus Kroon]
MENSFDNIHDVICNDPNNIVVVSMMCEAYFKKVITVIKKIHNRCHMKFINSQKKNGENTCKFIIIGDNSDNTINCTRIVMKKKHLKYLRCDEKQIFIKINVNDFCKKLNMINPHSEIIFYIKKDNINHLFINIITDENSNNVIRIPLMESDYNNIGPFEIFFNGILSIKTNTFFYVYKQIACSSKTIDIVTDEKTILFVYTHGNIDSNISVTTNKTTRNLGTFDLTTLSLISDFYEVCSEINMYFKENILLFNVPIEFGIVYFIIESKK